MDNQTSATQSGADTNTQTQELIKEQGPTARELELERIAEQVAAASDKLEGHDLIDEDDPPDNLDVDKTRAAPAAKTDEPRMVKVKVYGEEKEITEEELIRSYQKDAAAAKKLEEAVLKQQALELRETALAGREAQLAKQLQEPAKQSETTHDDVDIASQVVAAIYEGDEEKTREALIKLMKGRQGQQAQPTPDLTQITQSVTNQVKTQLAQESAMGKFLSDFADVVSDPYLVKIADEFLLQEQAQGKPYAAALQEAGNRTRSWIADKAPKQTTTNTNTQTRTERAKAKVNIDAVPSTSATAGGTDDAPEETTTSIISQMRKARGLPA